jgi:hypothetical protein
MLHTYLAALVLAAATLIASGCGSSKTASTPTAATATATTSATTSTTNAAASNKPLTRAEFIARGDAICEHLNQRLASLTARTQSAFLKALPQAATYEQAEYAELSKLTPPQALAKDWSEFLAATKEWSIDSAKLGEAARTAAGLAGAHALGLETKATHERLAHIAKRDGFKECSLV